MHQHEDAFGKSRIPSPPRARSRGVTVEGEIDTTDTNGVVSGTVERLPPALFLRETTLTRRPGDAEFAEATRAGCRGNMLALCTICCATCTARSTSTQTRPHAATTAAEAFELRRGVCQDFAHIFIAARAQLGVPARYVGGYSIVRRRHGAGRRPCLGRGLCRSPRLGRVRSRQRSAPPMRMCGSRSASIISGAAPIRGPRWRQRRNADGRGPGQQARRAGSGRREQAADARPRFRRYRQRAAAGP